ncbi:hypothetical protein [Dyadobacter pollutisoli]|uniref:Uncharacterized protein n=1 Tax=Dyadobacter pollutisoli TaxID=2910158 RepID=A0A9E8N8S5_9BACT|nr:hypothetical protein [Dyadobacter pollutisoli]WAC10017.1 hypothetical protein ON006_19920 [Dyadobacter pollutisoli]
MPQYRGTEGQLISVREAKVFTKRHQSSREDVIRAGKNYVEAEFFGLETFQQLLKECGGKPVGFRVYYGVREEDHENDEPVVCIEGDGKGKSTPRLIIVPVDAQGVDLSGLMSVGGHKDMPADGKVLVNGPICPRSC